jgi:hypothetical protein
MKDKKKEKESTPTRTGVKCDFCKNIALYESVKSVEPGPYSILYFIGGKDIGLIKANPKRSRDIESYCEEHVPKLEPRKILWVENCCSCNRLN